MPKLNYYVGEVRSSQCTMKCQYTWTLKAKSLGDAKRRLIHSSGGVVVTIQKIAETPMQHWKAG